MSSHPSINRESFQTFLADAFAVQESGLDAKSVASLIEIQQFIASTYFDLDRTMRMIADRARKVCSASGVAIAMLEGNALVYRSGSGSAAEDIGRRVPAVLSVSSPREMREILRVENANTDSRIESHICRQFGGVALLMLPIWKQGRLAGVLQVLYDDVHSFDEREVRTYRLMVGALEYGMAQQNAHNSDVVSAVEHASAVGVEPHPAEAVPRVAAGSAIPAEAEGRVVPQLQFLQSDTANLTESAAEIISDDPTIQDRLSDLWWVLRSAIRESVGRLWRSNLWNAGAAVTAILAFSVSIWIYHRAHSNPQIDLSTPALHDAGAGTVVKSPLAIDGTKVTGLNDVWKGTRGSLPRFMRMRVGPNEVDYIADDVTIRQFESLVPKVHNKSGVKQVDFGDDVTVRYFANTPIPVSQRSSSSEVSPPNNPGTDTVIKER